jgi:hypothetical protein
VPITNEEALKYIFERRGEENKAILDSKRKYCKSAWNKLGISKKCMKRIQINNTLKNFMADEVTDPEKLRKLTGFSKFTINSRIKEFNLTRNISPNKYTNTPILNGKWHEIIPRFLENANTMFYSSTNIQESIEESHGIKVSRQTIKHHIKEHGYCYKQI